MDDKVYQTFKRLEIKLLALYSGQMKPCEVFNLEELNTSEFEALLTTVMSMMQNEVELIAEKVITIPKTSLENRPAPLGDNEEVAGHAIPSVDDLPRRTPGGG